MKKKIIIVFLLILLIAGGIGGYLYLTKNEQTPPVEQIRVALSDYEMYVDCAENGDFGEGVVGYENNPTINPGLRVVCDFYIGNKSDNDLTTKQIELDYEVLGDFEKFEVEKLRNNDKIEIVNNHIKYNGKDIFEKGEKSENGTSYYTSATPFLSFEFIIKGMPQSDKVTLNLKNIELSNDKYIYEAKDFSKSYDVEMDSKYAYKSNEEYTEIVFYKNDNGYKEINKYKCTDECYVYAAQCFGYIDQTNGKIFILDDDKAILYDMEKGVIGKYATPLYSLYDNSGSTYEQKYFVGKQVDGNKYGIMDFNGNVIKDYEADEYGTNMVCNITTDSYSIKYNLITMKKDGKYGIEKITSNDLVTDFKYDDIRIYNDKYYKAKLDDKWSLYSFETNEKTIDEEYTQIFIPKDNILVVQIDDYLYIKDFTGNNLTEDKIKVLSEYNEKACCGASSGIYVMKDIDDDNIIKISVDNAKPWDDNYIYYSYIFNTSNNKLTKKDS